MSQVHEEFRDELRSGLAGINQRIDRLFLTLLAGMFGMVASLIAIVLQFA